MGPYDGKKAVVIGGTHGVGRAMTRALLAGGAEVLVTGRNETNVAALTDALGELAGRAHVLRSDAGDLGQIAALARVVHERLGALDAVFLNVGVAELEPFGEVTEASFDRQFQVNTKGMFFTAQQLTPLVREGGSLVFTTVTPTTGTRTMSVYTGSKAAVRAFVKVLGAELVAKKIRVNAVAPGFIETPTMGIASASAEQRAALKQMGDLMTPMKRHGSADEVALAALFLAFAATFTTGAELPVDGGLSEVEADLS